MMLKFARNSSVPIAMDAHDRNNPLTKMWYNIGASKILDAQEAKKWLRAFFKDMSLKSNFTLFLFFLLHLDIVKLCTI